MGRIKTSRVEKKSEERGRSIKIKMNRINSKFNLITTAPFCQVSLWKHQANAVKKRQCINRVGKRKGKNQQNREDKRAPES